LTLGLGAGGRVNKFEILILQRYLDFAGKHNLLLHKKLR